MADTRVPFSVLQDAFGCPATVTRPAPDDTPISTTVVWMTPASPEMPTGGSFGRREAARSMAIAKSAVPALPRRTRIVAAELDGGATQTWEVDGTDLVEADCTRVLVVPVAEAS